MTLPNWITQIEGTDFIKKEDTEEELKWGAGTFRKIIKIINIFKGLLSHEGMWGQLNLL